MTHELDDLARAIFTTALSTDRAGELLECLFEGGSATINRSGQLILASAAVIAQFAHDQGAK